MELETARGNYTEIMNDPVRLSSLRLCSKCKTDMEPGDVAFAVENYHGEYVGYICPGCHPNRKWVWALWRSVFNVNLLEVPIDMTRSRNGYVSRTVH